MKHLFRIAAFLALGAVALAQNINVQRVSGTNAITADLNFPDARTLSFGTATPGTITGSAGALNFRALGSNKPLTLTPSGTGAVEVVTDGTTSDAGFFSVTGTTTNPTNSRVAYFRNNKTSSGGAPVYVVAINRQNSGTPAWYLGVDANGDAIFATNGGNMRIGQDLSGSFTETMRVVGGTQHVLIGGTTDGTGQLQLLGTSGTSASGITFATDTNLYRTSAGRLELDGATAAFFINSTTGTTGAWASFVNTSGTSFIGNENSAGNQLITTNGLAYAVAIVSASTRAVQVAPGGSAAITAANATSTGLKFNGYGAGAITSDASGNLTAVSDARKKDIAGDFTRGLGAVLALSPKNYHWRKDSGLDPRTLNAGFIAQDVLPVIPEAIGEGPDGFYTFADRPITAALVNSTKTLTYWAAGLTLLTGLNLILLIRRK